MVTVTDGLQYNLNTVGAGTIMKEQLRSPVAHIDILLELATDTKEVHLLMLSLEVADHVVFINEGDDVALATIEIACLLKDEFFLGHAAQPFRELEVSLILTDHVEHTDLAVVQWPG